MDLLLRIRVCLQDLLEMFRYVLFGYSFYVEFKAVFKSRSIKIPKGKEKVGERIRKFLDKFENLFSCLFFCFRKCTRSKHAQQSRENGNRPDYIITKS